MNLLKKVVVLCLPWFLLACSTIPAPVTEVETVQPVSRVQEPKVQTKVAPVDQAAKASAAVLSLLKRAEQQLSGDNEQGAVASLERAIRIAPRYPESYLRLGELRYQQGQHTQARSLAEKALSLGAEGRLRKQALSLLDSIVSTQ
jgi:Tfp pilus assembly protein PilF